MKQVDAIINAIMIADTPDTFVTRRITTVKLEFGGIRGDRHFGITRPSDSRQPMFPRGTEILNRRQISILSAEECELIAKELGIEIVQPEWLGANLLISGMDNLTQLPVGSRILFPSGACLVCENENLPCTLPGEVIQKEIQENSHLVNKFVKAAFKKRGIVCSVEREGEITEGDQVQILINNPSNPMQ